MKNIKAETDTTQNVFVRCTTARRYPWYPCKQELSLSATAIWCRHTERSTVEKNILIVPYTYLNPSTMRKEESGTRISNDLQKQYLIDIDQ